MREVDVQDYLKATRAYAKARVRYSQEWQLLRRKTTSDMGASQAAIEVTNDECTVAYAAMKIAEARMVER